MPSRSSVLDGPTTLEEFLNTIPSPLISVLVGLAPYIAKLRHAIEIVSWKGSWEESCLAVALWWSLCLLGDVALRYTVPTAAIVFLVIARRSLAPQSSPTPVTEDSLQRTIADLTAIQALLLPTSTPSTQTTSQTALITLFRVSALIYVPYLLLTYFVRLRILIGITGTVLLTWRARWATVIRQSLWRSAWIRWGCYRIWSLLSGEPLPARVMSLDEQSVSLSSAKSETTSSIRFLFTIYENQRWWMGLDWTAALLPGERPSWCAASQAPVAPPSAFSLPAPTTVFMVSEQDKNKRVKRVARWKWEEEEWRVIVHPEGSSVSRVEKPIPTITSKEDNASKILRAAGKMRQSTSSGGGPDGSPERTHRREDSTAGHPSEKPDARSEEDIVTDADGWVYGDNKWESNSDKGGMGKYTRYRRWTRIAVLSETVEPAEPGEIGIRRDDRVQLPLPPPGHAHGELISGDVKNEPDDRSKLRKRLQAAVKAPAVVS